MKRLTFLANSTLKNFVGHANDHKCCYFKATFSFFNLIRKLNETKFKIKLLLENISMLNS